MEKLWCFLSQRHLWMCLSANRCSTLIHVGESPLRSTREITRRNSASSHQQRFTSRARAPRQGKSTENRCAATAWQRTQGARIHASRSTTSQKIGTGHLIFVVFNSAHFFRSAVPGCFFKS